jgi:hypothetical protein
MKKERLVIIMLTTFFLATSCSVEKYGTNLENYKGFYSPSDFTVYPATILLRSGDTVRGKMTIFAGDFLLSHPNNDSNVFRKNVRPYYLNYYRKWPFEEVKSYEVDSTNMQLMRIYDVGSKSKYREWLFLHKVTANGSPIDLYQHFIPFISPHEARKSTSRRYTGLFPDTSIRFEY